MCAARTDVYNTVRVCVYVWVLDVYVEYGMCDLREREPRPQAVSVSRNKALVHVTRLLISPDITVVTRINKKKVTTMGDD